MSERPFELGPQTRPTSRTLPRSPAELLDPRQPPRQPRGKSIRLRSEPRRMGSFLRFLNGALTLAFLLLLVGGGTAFYMRQAIDNPGPLGAAAVAVVPKGEGVYEIATRLEREGIISDRLVFLANYRTQQLNALVTGGKPVQIKAGEYEIRKGASVRQVLEALNEGRTVQLKVTMPEGLTSQQIVERLKADASLVGEIEAMPTEGSLLPDTYRFPRGVTRAEIIERMQGELRRQTALAWEKRQPNLPFKTLEEALVMASIVEKETGRPDERERVAAVFVNRLRKGMRLESDPTIIYGIVGGQGALGRAISKADRDAATAYNTYRITGLPPTPICNPGLASIKAVLNPAATNDLFFVSDGNGRHTFSTNFKDHLAAVAQLRKAESARPPAPAQAAAPAANGEAAPGADQQPVPQPAAPQQAAPDPTDVPLPVRKPKR